MVYGREAVRARRTQGRCCCVGLGSSTFGLHPLSPPTTRAAVCARVELVLRLGRALALRTEGYCRADPSMRWCRHPPAVQAHKRDGGGGEHGGFGESSCPGSASVKEGLVVNGEKSTDAATDQERSIISGLCPNPPTPPPVWDLWVPLSPHAPPVLLFSRRSSSGFLNGIFLRKILIKRPQEEEGEVRGRSPPPHSPCQTPPPLF